MVAELRVVETPSYAREDNVGTQPWSSRVRKRAKELSNNLETAYMELGRILYQVYDTPIDGDPKNGPVYKQWGYDTFAEYAEEELKLARRKAEHLRAIFFRLEVELAAMDPALKQEIIDLGWTKLRVLIRVLSLRNAAEWAKRARNCSYPELEEAVKKYRIEIENARAQALAGERPANNGGTVEFEAYPDVPQVERLYPTAFHLFEEQKNNVQAALQRAKELSGSDKRGHQLDLICMDFLSTNDFLKPGPEQKQRYLAKVEALLGVKLVAVDPQTKTILYGLPTLAELAEESETE